MSPDPNNGPAIVLISTMRDEGPFILEWLAYHRATGFSSVVICSNDCSDGSDRLLDALAARGLCHHLPVRPGPRAYPPRIAYDAARCNPAVASADWVMVLDADEFLVVHAGDGRVGALAEAIGSSALGMAVHWKCFGDGGVARWQDGMVRETFRLSAPPGSDANLRFKSIFRTPGRFRAFFPHAPVGFDGDWGGRNIWINSALRPLPGVRLTGDAHARATSQERVAHGLAQVNHYIIKSADLMAMRRARWQGRPVADRYDEAFVARYNVNGEPDETALRHADRFAFEHDRLTDDPELFRLHHECCARFALRLCRLTGLDPDQDDRVRHHLALGLPGKSLSSFVAASRAA